MYLLRAFGLRCVERIHRKGYFLWQIQMEWQKRQWTLTPADFANHVERNRRAHHTSRDNLWAPRPPFEDWPDGFTLHYPADNSDMLTQCYTIDV
jgi:hypothetical protein